VASMGFVPARFAPPRPRSLSATGWLRAVLFRGRLDAQLAAGLDPQTDPALALRARRLIRARSRRRLAHSVKQLAEEVDADRNGWLSAAVPFLRDQVVEARGTLVALAGALRDAEPVNPRGVAMTLRLDHVPGLAALRPYRHRGLATAGKRGPRGSARRERAVVRAPRGTPAAESERLRWRALTRSR
jgi:hypothetical protein